jgi:2-deoxy-D-gluconate 3-dehydrogenase
MGPTNSEKIVIVTGGSRGIGLACTARLLKEGYFVITVSRNPFTKELHNMHIHINADLADRSARTKLIDEISKRFPSVYALVNNAGISHKYSALDYPSAKWDQILSVNLTAPFELAKAAKRLGCRRIVNIASISAFNGARNIVGYATAKHGLIGMTKCLSNEWAQDGVLVNCVAPGFIETDMLELAHPDTIIGRIPVGRFGCADEVADAVYFLVSDQSKYTTGSTIVVDGGWLGR